ncbi:MAG: hypothetical protein ACLRVQ_05295 [Lachnospiraceae bacterium]
MEGKEIKDWEYDGDFYGVSEGRKVRSFEEIAAECEKLMENPVNGDMEKERGKLHKLAEKIGQIKSLSSKGTDVYTIAKTLNLEYKFVSDVLITISGSPEDDSDMAIAHLLIMDYQDED